MAESHVSERGHGAKRAAAVILGLGPDLAGELFRGLSEPDVRRIAAGARELRSTGQEDVPQALKDFIDAMERVGGDAAASENMMRDMVEKSLGTDVARRVFEGGVNLPPRDEILGLLSQTDAESLAMVLTREQPQTVALVLSSIDRGLALAVMERLPAEQRPPVMRRMATIESVTPEMLREVGQALSLELNAAVAGGGGVRKVDGRATTLEILRRSTTEEQTAVLAEIERVDETLANELRSKLFTFDDIVMLSDRDLQTLIKEIDTVKLSQALKGATPEIKQKFLKNMSTRAAQAFEDDLSAMGPLKLSVVEKAQSEIAKSALTLSEQDRITIVRPTDKLL